jgi:hypothetical protein
MMSDYEKWIRQTMGNVARSVFTGPPCPDCEHWRPEIVMPSSSGKTTTPDEDPLLGGTLELCHSNGNQCNDFSCFQARETEEGRALRAYREHRAAHDRHATDAAGYAVAPTKCRDDLCEHCGKLLILRETDTPRVYNCGECGKSPTPKIGHMYLVMP